MSNSLPLYECPSQASVSLNRRAETWNLFLNHFFADEVQPGPVQVPTLKPDPEKANPKLGVGHVAFSQDNRYLATKNG